MQNLREYELIHYTPLSCNGMIPPPLPPCLDPLPSEKKELAEQERKERQRLQMEQNKDKKKTMLSNFTSTVSQVATATADAISNFSDDLLFDSQSSGAEGRFRKYFPGFTSEKLFAEYETHLVCAPDSVIRGRCYISTSFISFHGEQAGKYSLVMLPFKGIQSIQKAVVTKPPPGIPSHYPPQFHIVVGGELGILPEGVRGPRVDSLVIYTHDGMQHMFFGFKYFDEMYSVLDHIWRNPVQQFVLNRSIPDYANFEFIQRSQEQQMEALRKITEFKMESDRLLAEQQFKQQQQRAPISANEFLRQQETLNSQPPLYPSLG